MRNYTSLRTDKLIVIGHISVYFGLLILTLRHFYLYPANHYPFVVVVMLIGFLPSIAYKLLPERHAPYLLVGNALLLVSLVFIMLREWALAGVFLLVPVFSLLFRDRKIYLMTTVSSLVLNIVLTLLFVFDTSQPDVEMVILLNVLTVFSILVFLIYFIVQDIRWHSMTEAKFLQTILTLSQSVEAKDPYTQGHSERVAFLGKFIAAAIPELNVETVYNCGLIHDVGKLSIPDPILSKSGRLTEEEYQIIKTHTVIGAKLCQNLDISQEIVQGVLHHHERWDGAGYPHGLRGEAIPLIGRVLCVADSIDAMCSSRSYREALDMEVVLGEIKRCSGTQFDPSVVRIVLDKWADIEAYYHYKMNERVKGGALSQKSEEMTVRV